MYTIWMALKGLGQFIYDFQTLLTGIGALVAAYVAAKPVWRQLELTQTQANGVLRDMLMQRQSEVANAASALTENVGKPLSELDRHLYWPDGEAIRLDEHQAFHHDQNISRAITWLRSESKHRDSSTVEAAKAGLIEKIDGLLTVLDHIHRPAHTEQHDEDHSFTDEQWAEFLARGESAKDEVEAALAQAQEALTIVSQAMVSEKAAIKARLKKLDEVLIAAS